MSLTDRIDPSRKNVRKFGILFGVLGLLFAGFLMYRSNPHWYFAGAAGGLFFLGAFAGYPVLRPLYFGWMAFAAALAWVNTRILLGLFYYLILTPVGVVIRLSGKDLLGERIDRSAPTYWRKRDREAFDRNRYERLF